MAGLPAYAEGLSGSTLRSSTIQLGVSNVMCGTASTPQDKKREAVASEGDGNEGLTLIQLHLPQRSAKRPYAVVVLGKIRPRILRTNLSPI